MAIQDTVNSSQAAINALKADIETAEAKFFAPFTPPRAEYLKFCKDCKHCWMFINQLRYCKHPSLGLDMVDGSQNNLYCSVMRESEACGKDGLLFEQKEVDPPVEVSADKQKEVLSGTYATSTSSAAYEESSRPNSFWHKVFGLS